MNKRQRDNWGRQPVENESDVASMENPCATEDTTVGLVTPPENLYWVYQQNIKDESKRRLYRIWCLIFSKELHGSKKDRFRILQSWVYFLSEAELLFLEAMEEEIQQHAEECWYKYLCMKHLPRESVPIC